MSVTVENQAITLRTGLLVKWRFFNSYENPDFQQRCACAFLSESRVGCEAIGKFEFEPQDFRWIV